MWTNQRDISYQITPCLVIKRKRRDFQAANLLLRSILGISICDKWWFVFSLLLIIIFISTSNSSSTCFYSSSVPPGVMVVDKWRRTCLVFSCLLKLTRNKHNDCLGQRHLHKHTGDTTAGKPYSRAWLSLALLLGRMGKMGEAYVPLTIILCATCDQPGVAMLMKNSTCWAYSLPAGLFSS